MPLLVLGHPQMNAYAAAFHAYSFGHDWHSSGHHTGIWVDRNDDNSWVLTQSAYCDTGYADPYSPVANDSEWIGFGNRPNPAFVELGTARKTCTDNKTYMWWYIFEDHGVGLHQPGFIYTSGWVGNSPHSFYIQKTAANRIGFYIDGYPLKSYAASWIGGGTGSDAGLESWDAYAHVPGHFFSNLQTYQDGTYWVPWVATNNNDVGWDGSPAWCNTDPKMFGNYWASNQGAGGEAGS